MFEAHGYRLPARGTAPEGNMTRIVTTTYRYNRPPRETPKAAASGYTLCTWLVAVVAAGTLLAAICCCTTLTSVLVMLSMFLSAHSGTTYTSRMRLVSCQVPARGLRVCSSMKRANSVAKSPEMTLRLGSTPAFAFGARRMAAARTSRRFEVGWFVRVAPSFQCDTVCPSRSLGDRFTRNVTRGLGASACGPREMSAPTVRPPWCPRIDFWRIRAEPLLQQGVEACLGANCDAGAGRGLLPSWVSSKSAGTQRPGMGTCRRYAPLMEVKCKVHIGI